MAILRANGSFLKANGKILVRPENKIDPDIVILQDWVTQVGLQPTVGSVPSASFDPDGPLDVSGTGWSGTPYVNSRSVGYTNRANPATNGIVYNFDGGLVLGDGAIDFTIEAWIRRTTSSNDSNEKFYQRFGLYDFSNGHDFLFATYEWAMCMANNGRKITWNTMPLGEWHHYALVVHDGNFFGFRDGIKIVSPYALTSHQLPSFVIRPQYYWATSWGSIYENPRLDYAQICLTKRAKWLENFSPPTRPYCLGMEE